MVRYNLLASALILAGAAISGTPQTIMAEETQGPSCYYTPQPGDEDVCSDLEPGTGYWKGCDLGSEGEYPWGAAALHCSRRIN